MPNNFTYRFPDVPFEQAPYNVQASPGVYPSVWFQPDVALRAAGILPDQPSPVSDLSELGPLRRNYPVAPGGLPMPPVAPRQDLMSQVLAPPNEIELRRVNMLRALGLPPAPQAVPPTFMPPGSLAGPATAPTGGGAGPIPPAFMGQMPPSPSLAMGSPYAAQGYAGDIMRQINAPTYASPMQGLGAFLAGWAGGGTQPNPVLQQLEQERQLQLQSMLALQHQWQVNEGQVAEAQGRKVAASLREQELAQNQLAKRADLVKDIAKQFWDAAQTPEQRQYAASMSTRAAEVAGIPLPQAITDAWKAGATTPAKNAQALAEVIAGSPAADVAARTGVPVQSLRALESLYQRSKQGDTNASQAIHYATGSDPQAAAKTAGEIQAQATAQAKAVLDERNLLAAGPSGLDTLFKSVVMRHGGWAKLLNNEKLMRAVADEYQLEQYKLEQTRAGMGNIGPEASTTIGLLGEAANAAVDLWKQIAANPDLVEKYTGLAGMGGFQMWIQQRFAGAEPTPEQYKLAALDYASNNLKALRARLLAGAAMGPNEIALYNQIFPDPSQMNAAQFRIASRYQALTLPILYEQYVAMQSLGAKQALANGTFSQFKLGVSRQYPLPSISKVLEEIQQAGEMQLPGGLKLRPRSP